MDDILFIVYKMDRRLINALLLFAGDTRAATVSICAEGQKYSAEEIKNREVWAVLPPSISREQIEILAAASSKMRVIVDRQGLFDQVAMILRQWAFDNGVKGKFQLNLIPLGGSVQEMLRLVG